ncbi:hypothetical protein PR202_ga08133 [Eleusine coracana subsp. coracana]|uniref:Uncharacterized protein n=1 Tax=Eleusine coracana subsp. coracana TaxID=191504 RepID=A0AAV5BZ91_ELECO|nr:hypothetical protein PR202_ga08133 [Eleusine coracana subsp. coracana]
MFRYRGAYKAATLFLWSKARQCKLFKCCGRRCFLLRNNIRGNGDPKQNHPKSCK